MAVSFAERLRKLKSLVLTPPDWPGGAREYTYRELGYELGQQTRSPGDFARYIKELCEGKKVKGALAFPSPSVEKLRELAQLFAMLATRMDSPAASYDWTEDFIYYLADPDEDSQVIRRVEGMHASTARAQEVRVLHRQIEDLDPQSFQDIQRHVADVLRQQSQGGKPKRSRRGGSDW